MNKNRGMYMEERSNTKAQAILESGRLMQILLAVLLVLPISEFMMMFFDFDFDYNTLIYPVVGFAMFAGPFAVGFFTNALWMEEDGEMSEEDVANIGLGWRFWLILLFGVVGIVIMHNNLQEKKAKDQIVYEERARALEERALEKRERALEERERALEESTRALEESAHSSLARVLEESARALEESATRERKKR